MFGNTLGNNEQNSDGTCFLVLRSRVMPRDGAIVFGDLLGKLDAVNVACASCGRAGHYPLQRLIAAHGTDAKLVDWLDEITADCPKRAARAGVNERCGARCPDLAKVL